ncbi:MAG: extracellular solute-binding protein [Azoarcus sp.]|jgi:sn-glycerol 3-phosphate transport system substrate-binding protein|nr:extracellular solute-binding protein [Azoarcus sp.]
MNKLIQKIGRRGALCALSVAISAALAMPAAAAPKKAKAAPKAEPTPAVVNIEISHRLSPARAQALQGLVERYNAQNPAVPVVIVEKDWRAAPAPHLVILDGPEEEAFLASKKPGYKPLAALMKGAGVALQTVKPPAMVTRKPIDAKGQLLALPVGLGTPVLFVNRAALSRAKLDPNNTPMTTWSEVQGVVSKLASYRYSCPLAVVEPAKVFIENGSAWNNVPSVKGKAAAFNGLFHVKYLSLMASWYRADLLKIFDRADAERRFASGECAMIVAPSDSWVDFRNQQGLDVAVKRLPYQDDTPGAPQNTLADGASLWATAGKKPAEYKAIANFVSFWLQPDNQVAWQREAGYLPLNRAGIFAADSNLLGEELENNKVAIGQLINRPVNAASSVQPLLDREKSVRILNEELADVWADRKSAKAALDNAVSRLSKGK